MEELRILIGESFILIDDEFFEVHLYTKKTKLKKDHAYIFDGSDIVKIYRGKYKKGESTLPGIYSKGDSLKEIKPDIGDRHMYSISNISELNVDRIFNTVIENETDFVLPEDIEVINNNSDIYVPTIKEEDDFLKYLVKKIILDKKINLKNYKGRFSNHYALTNMKSGLNRSTKMTVTNFKMWCEILGVDWEITIRDNGSDKLSPLTEDITITSDEF